MSISNYELGIVFPLRKLSYHIDVEADRQLARTPRKQPILLRRSFDLLGLIVPLMSLGYVPIPADDQADGQDQKLIEQGKLALHAPK
jgi:hypothetical protein